MNVAFTGGVAPSDAVGARLAAVVGVVDAGTVVVVVVVVVVAGAVVDVVVVVAGGVDCARSPIARPPRMQPIAVFFHASLVVSFMSRWILRLRDRCGPLFTLLV